MRLTINGTLVNPVLGRAELSRELGDASAVLTATVWTAPADTYFQRLSLKVGDVARLTEDDGTERFLGSIHALERTPQQVRLTAFDRGVYLTRNEVGGVFTGSGNDICRQVAAALGMKTGVLEADSRRQTIPALTGKSAYAVLRQAAGEGREVAVEGETLTVRKRGTAVHALTADRVREVSAEADIRSVVDCCVVVDRKGRPLATARNQAQEALYGTFQRILGKNAADPQAQAQAALRGRTMTAEVTVAGNCGYRCGDGLTASLPQWGLEGAYRITAVRHLWERGLFTTELTLEGDA